MRAFQLGDPPGDVALDAGGQLPEQLGGDAGGQLDQDQRHSLGVLVGEHGDHLAAVSTEPRTRRAAPGPGSAPAALPPGQVSGSD